MALLFGSIYLDLLMLLGGLIFFFYWYFTSTFTYWKKKGIPYLEPSTFFGNTKDFMITRTSTAEMFERLYHELGEHKYGGIWQSRTPGLLLKDPEVIKQFMVKDFVHFQDRGLPIDEKRNPLSEHLFNLEGTKWRKLRLKLTPVFTSGKMKMMFHIMNKCALELKEYLAEWAQEENDIEIKECLGRFTTDIIGSCAFGIHVNSIKHSNSEFYVMAKRTFAPSYSASFRRFLQTFAPPIAKYLKFQFPAKDVSDFFLSAVKDIVEYRESNNVVINDLLQLLIQLKNKGKLEDDKKYGDEQNEIFAGEVLKEKATWNGNDNNNKDDIELTDNLLAAQSFVFFLAGFETSSSTMSFCLHELAVNPDIQDRVRQEVDSVLAEYDGQITYDAIQKMEYLDKVVAETLRKYPPVPNLLRKVTKPYTFPDTGVHIEKGIRVIIPAYALQRDPKHFPDPEKFDPERFSEKNKAKRHRYTYLPFGEGPRICIGMRFGLMQTKIGLVTMLRNYQFDVCQRTSIPLRINPKATILTTMDGMWLKITNRV